jgi:hypothetical protein
MTETYSTIQVIEISKQYSLHVVEVCECSHNLLCILFLFNLLIDSSSSRFNCFHIFSWVANWKQIENLANYYKP